MTESVARFCRSRRVVVTTLVVLLLLAGVGVVFTYYWIGPIAIDEDDLLSATVIVWHHDVYDVPMQVDLSDPTTREEIAGLLNGLHRWHGSDIESWSDVDLDVTLRPGGPTYSVLLYRNHGLKLWIDSGEPDGETSMWVRSADMTRFLERYYEQYH